MDRADFQKRKLSFKAEAKQLMVTGMVAERFKLYLFFLINCGAGFVLENVFRNHPLRLLFTGVYRIHMSAKSVTADGVGRICF